MQSIFNDAINNHTRAKRSGPGPAATGTGPRPNPETEDLTMSKNNRKSVKLAELAVVGGIRGAYRKIHEMGGSEPRAYLYTCSRGREHAMAARFHRKHGVRVPVEKIDRWHIFSDPLNERAVDRYERTIEAHNRADSRVIRGGYREDFYIGCGSCAHIIRLRTGGRSDRYGAFGSGDNRKYFRI